jgi:alpha-tubulin suppressor-like RCC1 family protein
MISLPILPAVRLFPVLLLLLGAERSLAQTPRAAGGEFHTLVVTPHGRVIATGSNSFGELGIGVTTGDGGTSTYFRYPVEVMLPATNGSEMVPIIAVAAGQNHSVALAANGKVYTWGKNNYGQLGIGNIVPSARPVQVKIIDGTTGTAGLPDPVSDPVVGISAGGNHTLVRTLSGRVYAWGLNTSGQLGVGANVNQLSAKQIPGAFTSGGVTDIAAGPNHSLAVFADNVWSWGENAYGQLGTNDLIDKNVPTAVVGTSMAGVTRVASGGSHSLALIGGSVYAWGRNNAKQVANSATTTYKVPRLFEELSGQSVDICAGFAHSAALVFNPGESSGVIFTWGLNTDGQLGDGTITTRAIPVAVFPPFPGTGMFAEVWSGWSTTIGLKADGTLTICGDNSKGQCGNTPPGVTPLDQASMVFGIEGRHVSGEGHRANYISNNTARSYAFKPTARSWVWGGGAWNAHGVTGTTASELTSPVMSAHKVRFTLELTAWLTYEGLVLTRARSLLSGTNYGVQGNNSTAWNTTPTPVLNEVGGSQIRGIIDVSFAKYHAVAADVDGNVFTWGRGPAGGPYTDNTRAKQVSGLGDVVEVAAVGELSTAKTFALKGDGTVWTLSSGAALQVPAVANVIALASGASRVAALRSDGTVSFIEGSPGVTFTGITGVAQLAVGGAHWIACKTDGTVWTWGSNLKGELGTGSTSPSESGTPTRVAGLANVISVSAGDGTSAAVNADGTLWNWGRNQDYDLGTGNVANFYRPTIAVGFDYRLNPSTDTDNDGLPDSWENSFGGIYVTDGLLSMNDFDGDGMPDAWEQTYFGGNTDPDTDSDGDGLTNLQEYHLGSHPRLWDTNGNGIPDGLDDPDGDDIENASEFRFGLDPLANDNQNPALLLDLTYDALGRLETFGPINYTYDAEGNLLSAGN